MVLLDPVCFKKFSSFPSIEGELRGTKHGEISKI